MRGPVSRCWRRLLIVLCHLEVIRTQRTAVSASISESVPQGYRSHNVTSAARVGACRIRTRIRLVDRPRTRVSVYRSVTMPIHVSAQPGYSVMTYEDPYVFAEWETAMHGLIATSQNARLLVDRRNALAPSREFAERMVSFLERHAEQLRGWRTAVVSGDDAGFGVGRMMQLTLEARRVAVHIRVFRTYDEAEQWLHAESR